MWSSEVRDCAATGPKRDVEVYLPGPLVYVDTSDVRAGRLEELKDAIKELVGFIESNEDRRLQRVFQRRLETDDGDPCPRRLRVSRVPHGHCRPCVWTVRGPGHAVVDLYLRRAEREGAQAAA